jgi:hypothetical protein
MAKVKDLIKIADSKIKKVKPRKLGEDAVRFDKDYKKKKYAEEHTTGVDAYFKKGFERVYEEEELFNNGEM